MKRFIFIPAVLLLLTSLATSPGAAVADNQDPGETALTVYTDTGLEPLAETWKHAWIEKNPGIPLQITLLNSSDVSEITSGDQSVVLVRKEDLSSLPEEIDWKMVIGRDVITPIINAKNPYLQTIREQGISASALAGVMKDKNPMNWDALLGVEDGRPSTVYMVDDENIHKSVVRFLGVNDVPTGIVFVNTEEALHKAVAADPYAIGFGRLPMTESLFNSGEIVLLPIDRNGNGKLDYHEQIYSSLHNFMRGVWIGKYPHALVSSIYLAAPTMPTDELGIAFLKWSVTDGQPYVAQYGYGELLGSERKSSIDALTGEPILETAGTERWATIKIVLYIVVGLAAAIFLISTIVRSSREERQTNRKIAEQPAIINEKTMDIPAGLYYDKTHTWAYMDKQGYVKIGIDDFLQHVTGSFTRVEMKDSGEKVKKGEPFLTLVQDGKQLTIHAPISGTIKALNNDLLNEPDLVNHSPYDDGWVYLFEPNNWQRELQFMRMAVAYKDWLRNEFKRLRDFLAVKVNTHAFTYQGVALQDGGELTDRVMENLGPEVWEEFQKHFVDISY